MNRRGISVPVGTITIRQHRYDTPRAWVKIGQPSEWVPRAHKVWEDAGGPCITKGFVLHHIDGDSLNDNLTNLAMIPIGAHPQFHREVIREKQTGMQYETKTVRCVRCKRQYRGKYQRLDSVCKNCRRAHKKDLRKRRYYLTGT